MFILGVANQKGGVGKTTTAHNLGAGLARRGKKILMIDLDAQANLTDSCGQFMALDALEALKAANPQNSRQFLSSLDIMTGTPIQKAIRPIKENLDLIPGDILLSSADMQFAGTINRESLLDRALTPVRKKYDLVVLDCPPNLGLIAQNAFKAMTHVLIPVQCEYHSLIGLSLVEYCLNEWRKVELLRPKFSILGILPTFFDKRKTLVNQVLEHLRNQKGKLVLDTIIRDNVQLAEAPGHNDDIFTHSPGSYGAADYEALAAEVSARLGWQR